MLECISPSPSESILMQMLQTRGCAYNMKLAVIVRTFNCQFDDLHLCDGENIDFIDFIDYELLDFKEYTSIDDIIRYVLPITLLTVNVIQTRSAEDPPVINQAPSAQHEAFIFTPLIPDAYRTVFDPNNITIRVANTLGDVKGLINGLVTSRIDYLKRTRQPATSPTTVIDSGTTMFTRLVSQSKELLGKAIGSNAPNSMAIDAQQRQEVNDACALVLLNIPATARDLFSRKNVKIDGELILLLSRLQDSSLAADVNLPQAKDISTWKVRFDLNVDEKRALRLIAVAVKFNLVHLLDFCSLLRYHVRLASACRLLCLHFSDGGVVCGQQSRHLKAIHGLYGPASKIREELPTTWREYKISDYDHILTIYPDQLVTLPFVHLFKTEYLKLVSQTTTEGVYETHLTTPRVIEFELDDHRRIKVFFDLKTQEPVVRVRRSQSCVIIQKLAFDVNIKTITIGSSAQPNVVECEATEMEWVLPCKTACPVLIDLEDGAQLYFGFEKQCNG